MERSGGSMEGSEGAEADAVELLLARCLDRPAGERAAALAEASRAHPEVAAELAARAEALAAMGLWRPARAGAAAEPPERLGDFRLIERLGGGGMGVVYLAEQLSLARRVALKLVRPDHLFFEGARERFRRETEAVARLKHHGIVPIYVVGDEAGLPYFAMEWVEGGTLAEILRALEGRAPERLKAADLARALESRPGGAEPDPSAEVFSGSWVDACLRIARDVAAALEHAHARGILHRDVKPSNIALGRDGRVRLFDFGLSSSADQARLTQTGGTVGTLHYMSPEQIRHASRVDPRADVYSLGVTLYELLTLQVPYEGENQLLTQRLILAGRPDPIRARNRRVGPDVETVCLTAMDVNPARRYASAAAFARDLGNTLAQRPIEARPPGPLLRARRWTQRNPALATALGLGAVHVVGLPSALLAQKSAHAAALSDSLENEQREARTARSVEHSLVSLFETVDPFHAGTPDIRARDVLDRGVEEVDAVLAGEPQVGARLCMSLGRAYQGLGLYPEARDLYQRACAVFREVHGPGSLDEADADASRAWTLYKLGEPAQAEALLRGALEAFVRKVGEEHPQVSTLYSNLGAVLLHAQRYADAERELERAVELLRRRPDATAEGLVSALTMRGSVLRALERPEEAERDLREALAVARERLPGSVHAQAALNNHAQLLADLGRKAGPRGLRGSARGDPRPAREARRARGGPREPCGRRDLARRLRRGRGAPARGARALPALRRPARAGSAAGGLQPGPDLRPRQTLRRGRGAARAPPRARARGPRRGARAVRGRDRGAGPLQADGRRPGRGGGAAAHGPRDLPEALRRGGHPLLPAPLGARGHAAPCGALRGDGAAAPAQHGRLRRHARLRARERGRDPRPGREDVRAQRPARARGRVPRAHGRAMSARAGARGRVRRPALAPRAPPD